MTEVAGIGFECAKVSLAGARISISPMTRKAWKSPNEFNNDNIHYILADISSAKEVQSAIAATISNLENR
ncbi:hypothetical protein CS542_02050 [Pedobacter sp. IW39]|nr:hypothetical protein CS542_02050 [Pedobacter sp. IW39]